MKRIVDLTLPLTAVVRGVEIEPAMRMPADAWNATRLKLYSHCGTHMDAPRHFLPDGSGIDRIALEACIGSARVVDLTPVAPAERITINRLGPWRDRIAAGDRVLLRTDWSHRHATAEYRDRLPRIDLELARWLVERGVLLIGVEPPSVADVHNPDELTAVHRVLLEAGVVIVEGLCNLDQLRFETVELIALPLSLPGGDGSPIRAVAIETAEE